MIFGVPRVCSLCLLIFLQGVCQELFADLFVLLWFMVAIACSWVTFGDA